MKSSTTFIFLLLISFSILSDPHSAMCQPGASPSTTAPQADWDKIQTRVANLLGKLSTDVETFQMRFGINIGKTFLGSGSIYISKNKYSFLEAYSREASCHYLFHDGSGTCHLKTPNQTIIFRVGSDTQVPVPSFKINKAPGEGFQFDIQMNLASSTGQIPIVVFVHPETSSYIAKKLSAKYQTIKSDATSDSFFASSGKDLGVVIYHKGEQATGFEAWFDRNPEPLDGSAAAAIGSPSASLPPLHLEMNDFLVNVPIATPPTYWLSAEGKTPSGSIEVVYSFTTGFYSLLSSFMPKEGE